MKLVRLFELNSRVCLLRCCCWRISLLITCFFQFEFAPLQNWWFWLIFYRKRIYERRNLVLIQFVWNSNKIQRLWTLLVNLVRLMSVFLHTILNILYVFISRFLQIDRSFNIQNCLTLVKILFLFDKIFCSQFHHLWFACLIIVCWLWRNFSHVLYRRLWYLGFFSIIQVTRMGIIAVNYHI